MYTVSRYVSHPQRPRGSHSGPEKRRDEGGRAPRYRLSPDHFQKFKRMPAPDWAQKMVCIIVLNRRTHLLSSFRLFVHDGYCLTTLARFVHQAYSACKGNFYFLLS